MGILNRLTRGSKQPIGDKIAITSRTTAGVAINEDNAMTVGAVWGCLTYISEAVASMPWRVLQAVPEGNKLVPNHPIDRLLYIRPDPDRDPFQFKETLVHQALRYGNSYAEIERDDAGRTFALHLIEDPDRVTPMRDEYGRLFYRVTHNELGTVDIDKMDMFHLRGYGDDVVGINVIHYAAQSIGWAKASQLFGAAFFGNGMNVANVVRNKIPMSPESLAAQKASFDRLYSGPRNAHKTIYLDQEADFVQLTPKLSDAQFIETQRGLVEEICRFFRVPPHIVAELSRSTNNNIEHQSIEAVQRCLMPWVKRLEEEADYKLFGQNRKGYFTKLNMAAHLRGDTKAQAEAFRIYKEIGVYSTDDILEKLDQNKIGGDIGSMRTMNGSYAPLERILDGTAAKGAEPIKPANDNAPAKPKGHIARLLNAAGYQLKA